MTLYTELTIDQLRSAILQRDEQLRVALAEVEEWKQSTTAVALSSQEVENELKAELSRHKTLLEECRVELESVKSWRQGPEGPEVLFSQGADMLKKIDIVLHHLKALETCQTKSQ